MTKEDKSIAEFYFDEAKESIDDAITYLRMALYNSQSKSIESAYRTPQWHHTILWAGFAFLIGMLLGAGLMAS